MSGQYDVTYKIPGMIYTPGMPVMICGGNLLLDNINGLFLAQLKLQNIHHKVLNGIDVQILAYDSTGELIETRPYRYEGLRLGRDQFAGVDVAVPLNDSRCASLSVKVTGIFDADGRYMQADPSAEPLLIETRELKTVWKNDPELFKQYQLEYGREHKTTAYELADIWICSCGAANFHNEAKCHKCGCSKEAVLHPDLDRLAQDKKVRVAKEQADKAQAKAKAKRNGIIGGAIALAAVIIIVLITQVFIPEKNYRAATELFKSGKYVQAYEGFYTLDDYKDSKTYLNKAKDAYWKKIYNDILQGKVNSEIPEEFYEMGPEAFASADTKFSIADIDGDSIPELFVNMEGDIPVYSVTESYGTLEGPICQEWLYAYNTDEMEYCTDPTYVYSSYYDDDGMLWASWKPYPDSIDSTFSMNEEESYWDDETYMNYTISDAEDSYEVDEDEFFERLHSTIPEDTEYQPLKFYKNSKENRDTIIAK